LLDHTVQPARAHIRIDRYVIRAYDADAEDRHIVDFPSAIDAVQAKIHRHRG
tara:strand:+ start:589 stop:744 length:156 start_codon:yes stop_codon:yes gene_type:complete